MKKSLAIAKLAFSVIVAFAFTFILTSVLQEQLSIENPFEVSMVVTACVGAVQFFASVLGYEAPKGLAYMALIPEIWSKDIQDNLFQDNAFMNRVRNFSEWVSFKTVHVPQAAAGPNVVKDRSVLPGTISGRTDTELTFNLNSFTSDPIVLRNLDEVQLSYNKRSSILFNIVETLRFVISTHSLYAWAPSGASRIVRTTGTAVATNLPHSTATGTRKMITLADIAAAKKKLDEDNVPSSGRILLVNAGMYNIDILGISNIIQADQFGSPNLPAGVVARVMGFDIMQRSDVLVYDNTGTPVIKTIDGNGALTAAATSDNGAALAFHPNYLAHAVGAITPFYNENVAEYYGSIFSAEVLHGASKLRTDQKGVVAIVQAA